MSFIEQFKTTEVKTLANAVTYVVIIIFKQIVEQNQHASFGLLVERWVLGCVYLE